MYITRQHRVPTVSRLGIVLVFAAIGVLACADSNPAASQPEDGVVDDSPDGMVPLELADFDSVIAASTPYALVKFYLSLCAACAHIAPTADSLAAAYEGALHFFKVNVDDDDDLWKRYDVATVPAFLLFHHGEVIARQSFTTIPDDAYDILAAMLEAALAGEYDDPDDTTSPPAAVVELDVDNFSSLILEADGVAAVYFYLPACPACLVMTDSVEFLAQRFAGRALVGRIHASENLSISQQFDIRQVPAIVFFRNGSEYARYASGPIATVDELAILIDQGLDAMEQGSDGLP